jgi:dTDP-4-dehydrorhamnose reductase
LAAAAPAAGWAVTAAGHRRPGDVRLDVRAADQVADLVGRVRPRAVVHAAYRQDGPGARDVTATGSGIVAEAAAAAGARLVHLSTDVVFDGRAGRPYREDDPVTPLSAYGEAKADAEARVAAADPDAVLVRTSLVYGGPGRPASPHERAARDPDRAFYTDEIRCPVQVDDLAAAVLELCRLDVAGPLHVAGPEALSRWAFACRLAGREVRAATAPPGRPLDCRLDSSRAAALLRIRPRGVSEVVGGPP